MRMYVLSLMVAVFGLIGFAAPAGASDTTCLKNPLACINGVVCTVAAEAGLQCID